MSRVIEVDKGYKLVSQTRGLPPKFCYVSGRQGMLITLMIVSAVVHAEVFDMESEIAKVTTPDGIYNLMPCNEVKTAEDLMQVVECIKTAPVEFSDEELAEMDGETDGEPRAAGEFAN